MGSEIRQPKGMTMNLSPAQKRLAQIINKRSALYGGPFILSSGKESDFFCDLKPTLSYPEGIALVANLLLDQIVGMKDKRPDYVGGMEMGAPLITSALSALSFMRREDQLTFFVRKQPKGHGTNKRIEGLPQADSIANCTVAIIEDVTTTGDTVMKAAELIREDGGDIIAILTVLNREEGADEAFAKAGIPFKALLTRSQLEANR